MFMWQVKKVSWEKQFHCSGYSLRLGWVCCSLATDIIRMMRGSECDIQIWWTRCWKGRTRAQPKGNIFNLRSMIFECRMNDRASSALSCDQPLA